MARLARIAAVNLVVLAGLLMLIEGCVRVTHPQIRPLGTDASLIADSVFGASSGPRPMASGFSNGARFTADSSGFWTFATRPADTAVAWLLLGDSVTMGVGVDPDRTFAGRIADAKPDVRVLNPSIVGHSVDDYEEILIDVARRDSSLGRVTVLWCLNDIYTRVQASANDTEVDEEGRDPDQRVRRMLGPVLGFIHRHVYTYQWLKAALFDRPRHYFEHDLAFYHGAMLKRAVDRLAGIASVCREHELRCEVVLLPYEYQLRTKGAGDAFLPQQRIREHAHALNLPVFDAAPFLMEAEFHPAELYLYGDGIHFSERGHALLAEYILELDAVAGASDGWSSGAYPLR